ncbi:carbonic anhydrase family protein [Listeria grayi]|uniref:carbonic anhydrase family protein n=1 Tax=Listeria grayi TaxID=1641 RepID=UPI002113DB31|nr:carbonic anhydrase family protein [Listeria grayi]
MPLSENVEWYVMQHPVSISSAQIKAFEKHYKANNRKTQPLHGRKILEHHE